jgi:propanol-preferring alcohol dehydrogenase
LFSVIEPYSEYTLANADYIYSGPDNLTDSEAASLFCPRRTAHRAVRKAELRPGKRVAVFGVGGVGHMVTQFARLHGSEVIVASRNSKHHAPARELGAATIVDTSKGDEAEWLEQLTKQIPASSSRPLNW